MALDLVGQIESLPGWSEFKEITVKRGPLRVKVMHPVHRDMWNLWKQPTLQEQMVKEGYDIRKLDGVWKALRFVEWISPKSLQEILKESEAMDTNHQLLAPPGLEYRAFQRAGIKYCTDRLFGQNGFAEQEGVLVGDDMGLGKTIQFLGILNQDHNIHQARVLIVCPASLKLNWRNEARKWLVDGVGHGAVVVKDKWPDMLANIVIVNYDTLHKWESRIREESWDYVCFDEAHYLKNEKARRTIMAMGGAAEIRGQLKMVRPIPAKKWVFLSGTPIENGKAVELWTIVEKCDPEGLGAKKTVYVSRYSKSDEHLEELQMRLRAKFMVRRMKNDVLKELPPKVRQVVAMDPDDYGGVTIFGEEMRIFREYQACLAEWGVRTELAKAESVAEYRAVLKAKKAKLGMTAGELSKLRQKTAIAKAPGVVAQVKEVLQESSNLILFAHHLAVLDVLEEGLRNAGISVVRVDGGTKIEDRQKAMEEFQAGKFQVFLGGIKPAGVGLTLTKADRVAFAELDWLPGAMTQAEDRAHRIGQLSVVFILHYVMEESLDEYMAKRLIEKQEKIERMLDSMADEDDEDEDDARDSFVAPARAVSKGVKTEKILEEGERMSELQRKLAKAGLMALQDKLVKLNEIDRGLAMQLAAKAVLAPGHFALARRLSIRYRSILDMDLADLEWPKAEKERANA